MADLQRVPEQDAFASKVILVVEDDPDLSEMLKGMIEMFASYQVVLATDALQAWHMMRSVQPDLFLFDYRLPGIDGLEFYHRLHAQKEFSSTPVLFLSAFAPKGLFEKQHLSYLGKPFEMNKLLEQIDFLLTPRQAI